MGKGVREFDTHELLTICEGECERNIVPSTLAAVVQQESHYIIT